MNIPKLMLLTEGRLDTDPSAIDKVMIACECGIPAIQLREKQLDTKSLWNLALHLRAATRKHNCFFSINDRLDIALLVQADGIHLPERGLSPQIPKKINPALMVGISTHSLEASFQAEQEGADYILFGPIFQTASKASFGLPQGLDKLKEVASCLSIPVIAVGGITPKEVKECRAAGAYGVAAIGAFVAAQNLSETIKSFQKELS